jgi:hypothetical protein
MNEARMRTVLLVAAAYHLLLGAYMFFAPGSFYDVLGEFPPENDHYIRDVATLYIALGVVLYVSSRRPSWRVPILSFAVLQYLIHVLVHVIDVDDAASEGKGWFAVFALSVLTAALAFLLGAAARGVREPRPERRRRDRDGDRDREPEPEGEREGERRT